jgi:MFS transporter, NNP family, nitrate/nitrite transporter
LLQHAVRAFRQGHWPSLVGAWLHFEVSFMVWLLIAALGVSIAEDFALGPTQKGLLVALPLLAGALLRIPVGVASDLLGTKMTGLALLGVEFVALLWAWLGADSFPELLAIGLLLGIAGASFAVAMPLASRAYPPSHQGLAMGIAASANSGTVLAAFFAPRLAQAVGWRGVFGLMVPLVLASGLLFAMLVPSDRTAARAQRSRPSLWPSALKDLLRMPVVYWFSFVYAITFGGFVGFCSFLPIFLHDQYGLDIVRAGSWAALCGLAGSLARPFGGHVADRLGGLAVLRWLFPLLAGLTLAVADLPRWSWAGPLLVMALAAMGFGNGVVFQVVSERLAKQIGMASGVIGAAGGLGGFFVPLWLGLLKDATGSYGPGFLMFSGLTLAAAGTVILALRGRRNDESAV